MHRNFTEIVRHSQILPSTIIVGSITRHLIALTCSAKWEDVWVLRGGPGLFRNTTNRSECHNADLVPLVYQSRFVALLNCYNLYIHSLFQLENPCQQYKLHTQIKKKLTIFTQNISKLLSICLKIIRKNTESIRDAISISYKFNAF